MTDLLVDAAHKLGVELGTTTHNLEGPDETDWATYEDRFSEWESKRHSDSVESARSAFVDAYERSCEDRKQCLDVVEEFSPADYGASDFPKAESVGLHHIIAAATYCGTIGGGTFMNIRHNGRGHWATVGGRQIARSNRNGQIQIGGRYFVPRD